MRLRTLLSLPLSVWGVVLAGCVQGHRPATERDTSKVGERAPATAVPAQGESAIAMAAGSPQASGTTAAAPFAAGASAVVANAVVDRSGITIFLHPADTSDVPAEFVVTDPAGRRTGFDSIRGESFVAIPKASYDNTGIEDVTDSSGVAPALSLEYDQSEPMDGDYTLTVFGTKAGHYSLDVRARAASGGLPRIARRDYVATTPGAVHVYRFRYGKHDTGALILERTQ